MEYKYLITDIQEKTKVSITSLTTFKNKHKDFFNKNTTRIRRKIYYNQAAMDFFLSYYAPEQNAEKENPRIEKLNVEEVRENQENPRIKANVEEVREESPFSVLEAEIDTLHTEIDALRRQLEEKEEERKELIRQNGALILTLQQEKQEKQLFLPAPKKSIGDKLKGIFKSKN